MVTAEQIEQDQARWPAFADRALDLYLTGRIMLDRLHEVMERMKEESAEAWEIHGDLNRLEER
ncbi:hypothetical protein LCGC14_0313680 [marine sediment metagenome]|uniref:Uncharacterized protein n=1 Tax=marine sediment metagenome TaxID=412755 RepID=A0A0F9W8U3_9ZZZZ